MKKQNKLIFKFIIILVFGLFALISIDSWLCLRPPNKTSASWFWITTGPISVNNKTDIQIINRKYNSLFGCCIERGEVSWELKGGKRLLSFAFDRDTSHRPYTLLYYSDSPTRCLLLKDQIESMIINLDTLEFLDEKISNDISKFKFLGSISKYDGFKLITPDILPEADAIKKMAN